MNRADRLSDFGEQGSFGDDPQGSILQCTADKHFLAAQCNNLDPDRAAERAYAGSGIESVDVRHVYVHRNHIRLQARRRFYGLTPVARFSDTLDIRRSAE